MKRLRLKKSALPLPAAPIRLFLGDSVFELASPSNPIFYRRLKSALRHIPERWGVRLPEIEVCHSIEVGSQGFLLKIAGEKVGAGQLFVGRLLALGDDDCLGPLLGEADFDPIYGLSSKWILPSQAQQAESRGCHLMEAETILITLFLERIPTYLHHLVNLQEVEYLLKRWREKEPSLVEAFLQRLPSTRLLELLRNLLKEQISVSRLDLILEGALRSPRKKPGTEIGDLAREALSLEICRPLADSDGRLSAIVLAKWLEARWKRELNVSESLEDWFLLRFGQALELEMQSCWSAGYRPVLIVDSKIRQGLAELLRRSYPDLPVISWAEVPPEISVQTAATLGSQLHPLAYAWRTRTWPIVNKE